MEKEIPKWEDQKVIKTYKNKNYTIEICEQDDFSNDFDQFYRKLAEIIYKDYLNQEKLIKEGKLEKNSWSKE